jgi:hypothetical protein
VIGESYQRHPYAMANAKNARNPAIPLPRPGRDDRRSAD